MQVARVTAAKIHLEDVRAACQRSHHSGPSTAESDVLSLAGPEQNIMLTASMISEDFVISEVQPSLEVAFMSI